MIDLHVQLTVQEWDDLMYTIEEIQELGPKDEVWDRLQALQQKLRLAISVNKLNG